MVDKLPAFGIIRLMAAHRKNFDEAVRLYNSGSSIEEVAKMFSVTRQAMYACLIRRGVKFRSRIRFKKDNHFYRGGPVRNASIIVKDAVRNGILSVAPCEVCGLAPLEIDGRQRIQAHHDDYNQLLSVRWLCKKHHFEWHKNNKAKPRTIPMMSHKEIASICAPNWKKTMTRSNSKHPNDPAQALRR